MGRGSRAFSTLVAIGLAAGCSRRDPASIRSPRSRSARPRSASSSGWAWSPIGRCSTTRRSARSATSSSAPGSCGSSAPGASGRARPAPGEPAWIGFEPAGDWTAPADLQPVPPIGDERGALREPRGQLASVHHLRCGRPDGSGAPPSARTVSRSGISRATASSTSIAGFNGEHGLLRVDAAGDVVWRQPERNVWSVELADVDGDGSLEILHSRAGGDLVCGTGPARSSRPGASRSGVGDFALESGGRPARLLPRSSSRDAAASTASTSRRARRRSSSRSIPSSRPSCAEPRCGSLAASPRCRRSSRTSPAPSAASSPCTPRTERCSTRRCSPSRAPSSPSIATDSEGDVLVLGCKIRSCSSAARSRCSAGPRRPRGAAHAG